jgi:tetraacyldisaccharide 4'-kinase
MRGRVHFREQGNQPMKSSGPGWSQIHRKKSPGLWSPLLTFSSALYGIGIRLRLWAYEYGLFKRESLPGFVISVGNITAGGTGKTPAVLMLAQWARNEGHPVAVLSMGYGGQYRTKVLSVSDGNRIKAGPEEAGDEPYLLATRLSGIPVVVSKKRFLAGLFAHEKYGCDFFILDDGFQHLELHRDLNLALIDSTDPLGNGNLLPRGPLREPVEQLARANACIVTRCEGQGSGEIVPRFLKVKFSSIPVFCADHVPESVVFPHSKEVNRPEFLNGKRVLAFAGIARPERFKQTLIGLGADVAYFEEFRDHYPFKWDDINALMQMKEKQGAEYIITTEKDWVRVSPFAAGRTDMAYLTINFEFTSGREEFFRMIKDNMAAKRHKTNKK